MHSIIHMEGASLDAGLEMQRGDSEISLIGSILAVNPIMTANNAPSPYVVSASSEYSSGYAAWYGMNGIAVGIDSWQSSTSSMPQWWRFDHGVGGSGVYNKLTMKCYAGYPDRLPNTFKIRGSQNATDWTDLSTQAGITWSDGETKTFTWTNTTAYRYYDINITAINGGALCGFGEVAWFRLPASNSPVAVGVSHDSGANSTVWGLSAIANRENLEGETGNIKYQYASGNSVDPTNWNGTWLTLAQLQAVSDITARYFRLKAQFNSDGTQDASLQDTFIEVTIAAGGTIPAVSNVRLGIAVGDGLTGTLVVPSVGDVREAIGYGAAGTEYVGTARVYTLNTPDPGTDENWTQVDSSVVDETWTTI